MKKVLPGILAVVLILGIAGAVGFAGYRYGFDEGARSASNGGTPSLVPGHGFGPHRMPMHNFGNGFDHRFGERGFIMMQHGRGFRFFSPLMFLLRIAFWGLVLWAIYMLVMRSGWHLTRATQPNETQPKPAETEEQTTEN